MRLFDSMKKYYKTSTLYSIAKEDKYLGRKRTLEYHDTFDT
jgi:hypothetical protein